MLMFMIKLAKRSDSMSQLRYDDIDARPYVYIMEEKDSPYVAKLLSQEFVFAMDSKYCAVIKVVPSNGVFFIDHKKSSQYEWVCEHLLKYGTVRNYIPLCTGYHRAICRLARQNGMSETMMDYEITSPLCNVFSKKIKVVITRHNPNHYTTLFQTFDIETAVIAVVESNEPISEKDISTILRYYGVSLKPVRWRKCGRTLSCGRTLTEV